MWYILIALAGVSYGFVLGVAFTLWQEHKDINNKRDKKDD